MSSNSARLRRFLVVLTMALILTIGAFAGTQTEQANDTGSNIAPNNVSVSGPAAETLEKLDVKGRAPKTGYSREQFGPGWEEAGGCSTRERILQRDLKNIAFDPIDCEVLSGRLSDPYTGKEIWFTRGLETSDDVQIDHVVALSDAWQKGAQQLDYQMRVSFANDDLELLAVDGPANIKKGDGDAATWLPPNKAFRCSYVARQIAVKAKYNLWVTQAEHNAMKVVLSSCPGHPLPTQ